MTRKISESDAKALSERLCAALGEGWRIESMPTRDALEQKFVVVKLMFKDRMVCSGWTWTGFLDSYFRYSSFTFFLPWEVRPSVSAGSVEELELKLAVMD